MHMWLKIKRWFLYQFKDYRWARKCLGGIWEKWWVDPCSSWIWLHVHGQYKNTGIRPKACWLNTAYKTEGEPETEIYR